MSIFGIGPSKEEIEEGLREQYRDLEKELALHCTCLSAPYQFEGWYRGHMLYLRSRHGKTRLDIDGETVHEIAFDIFTPLEMLVFLANGLAKYEARHATV